MSCPLMRKKTENKKLDDSSSLFISKNKAKKKLNNVINCKISRKSLLLNASKIKDSKNSKYIFKSGKNQLASPKMSILDIYE